MVLVVAVGAACSSSSDGVPGSSVMATVEGTVTLAPTAPVPTRVMEGQHFRAEAPSSWLLVDPESPLDAEQERTVAELPAAMRDEVLQVHRGAATEVILIGLPTEVVSRIVVVSDCEAGWSYGPGDWVRRVERALRDDGGVVGMSGVTASVGEIPYPVLKVRNGSVVQFGVHPVSWDGCTYEISLHGDEADAALPGFVTFVESLELGRDRGDSSLPEDSLVPAGWTAFAGRNFDAALPTDWFYNDGDVPLTAEQLEVIAELPTDVAGVLLEDQGFGEELEMLYLGLPTEFDPFLTVISLCDGAGDVTASEWVEVATDKRMVEGAEVTPTGMGVTVDGRPHEVFLVEYPGAPQYDVYPIAVGGCGFGFAVSTPGASWPMLMDFMMFMQTVDVRSPRP